MAEMSPLRRRMIEDMTVRNLSPATQRSYMSGSVWRTFAPSRSTVPLGDLRRCRRTWSDHGHVRRAE